MHFSIKPKAQFIGILDFPFLVLNDDSVEMAVIYLDDSITDKM